MKSLNSTMVTSGSTLGDEIADEEGFEERASSLPGAAKTKICPTITDNNNIGAALRTKCKSPSNCRYRSGGMNLPTKSRRLLNCPNYGVSHKKQGDNTAEKRLRTHLTMTNESHCECGSKQTGLYLGGAST